MLSGMFTMSEAEAAAIRAAYERGGELAAAVELLRYFAGIDSIAQAGMRTHSSGHGFKSSVRA